MRTILRTINSPKLLGIEKDHFDHSGSAPMRSTGNLHQMREDETDLMSWWEAEPRSVCVRCWEPPVNDLVVLALERARIIGY